MLKRTLRKFTFVHDLLGLVSKNSSAYIIGQYAPTRPLPEHSPITTQDSSKTLHLTTLPNGVRVVTESQGLPSSVHLGVTISAGTRDETEKYSSVVHSLAQTHLKTNVRTNEQINYGMIQMSGGAFEMNYNQEFMNYHGHCLAHDTYDIVQMLSDCVLDEKTVMDEEAAQWRIDEWWKFRSIWINDWARLNELWLSVAYGNKGLGMPLSGFESNFQNIGHYYMNQWRKYHVTPDRMIVWGAGIKSHNEFVETVYPYFSTLDAIKGKPREATKYIGGDHRELNDEKLTTVSFSLQGPDASSGKYCVALILQYILGSTGSGQGARVNSSLHQKVPGFTKIETEYAGFSDTGNLKINFAVKNEQVKEACEALTKELLDIGNLTDAEVVRAQKLLTNDVLRKSECPKSRLVLSTQQLARKNELFSVDSILPYLASVTKEDIKALVDSLRKSRPTVVAIGGNVHDVPTSEGFHSKLR